MADRAELIGETLARAGLQDWARHPLAGDASRRRYERLMGPDGQSYILMDAPPEVAGSIDPFLRIGDHLRDIGLRPPAIHFADSASGLILMEDFGDDLLAVHAHRLPDMAPALYALAAEALAVIQDHPPPPGLPVLDPTEAVRLVAEVAEWLPGSDRQIEETLSELDHALRSITPDATVLALRDYHAENIVVCPDAAGLGALGLLDFQDAVIAHPVYDLVSLIRDVRRDVPAETEIAAIARFADLTGETAERLSPAIAVQGIQRNLRIFGVFRRLAHRDGKARYLEFVPRLRGLLARDLSHPAVPGLARAAGAMIEASDVDA